MATLNIGLFLLLVPARAGYIVLSDCNILKMNTEKNFRLMGPYVALSEGLHGIYKASDLPHKERPLISYLQVVKRFCVILYLYGC